MKKIIFVLAVVLLASPAWAVDIECTVDGCDVTVSFSGAVDIRAFAVDIQLDGNGEIGDVQCLSAAYGYQIYPGDIDIDDQGYVDDWGSCKCDGDYPGTLDEDNAMTIEAGSLFEEGQDPDPCEAGDLVSFRVSGSTLIDVTITVNEIRGGVVNEAAGEETPGITDCNVDLLPVTCLNSAAPEFDEWQAWGSPDCWCYERQCRGDINGELTLNKWVQALDLTMFRAAFNKTDLELEGIADGICADLNHTKNLNKRVQALDLTIFRDYFNEVTANVPVCDQSPVTTGPYNFWTN